MASFRHILLPSSSFSTLDFIASSPLRSDVLCISFRYCPQPPLISGMNVDINVILVTSNSLYPLGVECKLARFRFVATMNCSIAFSIFFEEPQIMVGVWEMYSLVMVSPSSCFWIMLLHNKRTENLLPNAEIKINNSKIKYDSKISFT